MQTNQPKQNNQKIKTAVIFGGYSSEYSVSLQSATAVLQNLDPEKYELVPVGITKAGDWFYYTGAYFALN